jgi:uncharacterized protein
LKDAGLFYCWAEKVSAAELFRDGVLCFEQGGHVTVALYVVPNAAATSLTGLHGFTGESALRLKLKAPPTEGRANNALRKWLADGLQILIADINLRKGAKSRYKMMKITAASAQDVDWDLAGQPDPYADVAARQSYSAAV